jgi:SAM-dependent methyltransferase
MSVAARPRSLLTVAQVPIQRFFDLNRKASHALERRLPHASPTAWDVYQEDVEAAVRGCGEGIVVDVGGGRSCSFATVSDRARIIAVDVSAEELSHNHDVAETRVADAQLGLPFEDGEAAVVVSRTVLEHVEDVDAFFGHAARVLQPGGVTLHLIPCRYAPFAIPARIIPFRVGKAIAHFLRPSMKGVVEFPVYYDICYPSAIERSLRRHGFTDVEFRLSYYQSDWYDALFPAYAASAAYEAIVAKLGKPNLCAFMVVKARKGAVGS